MSDLFRLESKDSILLIRDNSKIALSVGQDKELNYAVALLNKSEVYELITKLQELHNLMVWLWN